jgi:hypothetical protein
MQVLQGLAGILFFVTVPVAGMLAVWYGARALGWSLHNYPWIAVPFYILLTVALIVAAFTFNRFFPGCHPRDFSGVIVC